MSVTKRISIALLLAGLTSACGGDSSSSTSPSQVATAPAPPGAATPVTQNGCAATFACPSTDVNGNANPSTPVFGTLTVANGTSSSCRAPLPRNSPDSGIAVQFTAKNVPQFGFSWKIHTPSDSIMTLFPNGGFFDGAGQGSATAHFNPNALPPQATGQVFSQNLVIDLIATPPGAPGFTTVTTVATCGVTLYGAVQ